MLKFDNVLCLCKGEIVYFGPPHLIRDHFSKIGFAPPNNTNPADHLMTILNEDDIKIKAFLKGEDLSKQQVNKLFDERLDQFSSSYAVTEYTKAPASKEDMAVIKENHNSICFLMTWWYVIKRFLIFFVRDPLNLVTALIQYTVLTIFFVILFADITDYTVNTLAYIQDVNGFNFNITLIMSFGTLTASLEGIVPLMPNFLRDYDKRLYSPTIFYLVSSLIKIPFYLFLSGIMLIILVIVVNVDLGDDYEKLPPIYGLLALAQIAAGGFGDLLAVGLQNKELANQMFPLTIVPLMLVSGALGKVKDMLINMQALSFISFLKYCFQGISLVYYDDALVKKLVETCKIIPPGCDDASCAESRPFSEACNPRGTLDFIEDEVWINVVGLVALAIGTRVIAIIILNLLTIDRDIVYTPVPPESTFEKPFPRRKGMKIEFVEKEIDGNGKDKL